MQRETRRETAHTMKFSDAISRTTRLFQPHMETQRRKDTVDIHQTYFLSHTSQVRLHFDSLISHRQWIVLYIAGK